MNGASEPSGWQLVLFSLGCILAVVVLAVGVLWLWEKLSTRRKETVKLDEYSRRFHERLLNPDFAVLESHFDTGLPDVLKELYADKEAILRGDFEIVTKNSGEPRDPWFIAFYEPADADSVREAWPGCERYFAFANDGCGNEYLIKPGAADPEVLFHDHETGEKTLVSRSLSAFLAAPRQNPPD